MNIPQHILAFLKMYHKAEISGFGTFSLKNTTAAISEDGKILPPAQQVDFEADFEIINKEFSKYLSKAENISENDVEGALLQTTEHWKNKLKANQQVEIPEIGTISNSENGLQFSGERLEDVSPDFYGLEEISLAEIKESKSESPITDSSEPNASDYQFNKSILWIFLVFVPFLGLLYFGITQQELLFGKKSFNEVSIKTSTRRIVKDSAKIDSSKINKKDSLQNDSLKGGITPLNTNASNQKWSNKNHHTSKKWKSKKRPNH